MAKKKTSTSSSTYTAATADRHVLYGLSVQNVEAEIDFIDQTYKALRGQHATTLREDFCGTANTCCEWVRRRKTNIAVAVDLDTATLDWAREHNLPKLSPSQRDRLTLLERDVRDTGPKGKRVDCVLAMNFSYWIFRTRDDLRAYFASVRADLAPGGLFCLDFYGGYESMKETVEKRPLKGFTYVWDQSSFDPISSTMQCYIHFRFPDGSKMNKAFSYEWRVWTLPEIRELLAEAGYRTSTVYWEGEDDKGEGTGEYEPREVGDADPAFICYIVAEK